MASASRERRTKGGRHCPGQAPTAPRAANVTAGLGALAFSRIDERIGSKPTILWSLVGLTVPGVLMLLVGSPPWTALFGTSDATYDLRLVEFDRDQLWFWIFGLVLGIFVGPAQAASRSYLARAAPEDLRTQMFGLYALSGKATAFLGPLLVGSISYAVGSQRWGHDRRGRLLRPRLPPDADRSPTGGRLQMSSDRCPEGRRRALPSAHDECPATPRAPRVRRPARALPVKLHDGRGSSGARRRARAGRPARPRPARQPGAGDRRGGMVRYAYGDWDWYARGATGALAGSSAVLWPSPAALGRRRLPGPLSPAVVSRQVRVAIEDAVYLTVEAPQVRRLIARLDRIFDENRATRIYKRSNDLFFVRHPEPYWILHNSNQVVGDWLEQLGCRLEGPIVLSNWQRGNAQSALNDARSKDAGRHPQSGRAPTSAGAETMTGP